MSTRLAVLWCPCWPLLAAGTHPEAAAAVVKANRIMVASQAAIERGVGVGMTRREAQSRCPELELVQYDPGLDARCFETIVSAFEIIAPRVEVSVPGILSFAARGPSRYLGGELPMARRSCEVVNEALRGLLTKSGITSDLPQELKARIGIAEGYFAAKLAAQLEADAVSIVEVNKAKEFLAPLPIEVLATSFQSQDEIATWDSLVDLLGRLGLHSLGDFARLSASEVSGRLGPEGILAHRLAQGLDPKPLATRAVPDDLMCELYLDPPISEISAAAFLARGLAAELHEKLAKRGIACTCVAIEARTEHGEELLRIWSHSTSLSAEDVADRVRWQLAGWLTAPDCPTAALELLRLVPQTLIADGGSQLDLWGEQARPSEEIVKSVARLQGLLGSQAVLIPELCGGRGPAEQVKWVVAHASSLSAERPVETPEREQAPWPGRLGSPAPSLVPAEPYLAALHDNKGAEVLIDARGTLSGEPALLEINGEPDQVVAWAGPWPLHERWWGVGQDSRLARIQLLTASGRAYLFSRQNQQWWLEGIYD